MKEEMDTYWNHNTVYHKWILSQVRKNDRVLDVGCGDGLLVYKLANKTKEVLGIDKHIPSIEKAKKRIENLKKASIISVGFEDFDYEPNSFDAIIFVASIHHMNLETCIDKAIELLKPNGKLLIVGLANPYNVFDKIIEVGRFLPVKIGDIFHEVKGDVGAPIMDYKGTLNDIRSIVKTKLPNAKVKQVLYYRYLLKWVKP